VTALDRVRHLIEAEIDQGAIAGAQVSVRGGDGATDLCAGYARPGQDMSAATMVPWFSAGKVVTSLILLRLAQEGRLALDQPAATWIPEFRRPVHDQITLLHLLTHTSGLRDRGRLPFGPARVVVSAAAEPGSRYSWAPGTHCAYSRYVEWYVLSVVIEEVTGEPVQAALSAALRGCGAGASAFGLTEDAYDERSDQIAYIYRSSGSPGYQRLHASRREACRCDRVGNGLGPMRDLAAVTAALLPGQAGPGGFLSEDSKALARSLQANGTDQYFGLPLGYGLGVMVDVRWRFGQAWQPSSFGHVGSSVVGTLADPRAGVAAAIFVSGRIRSRSLSDSTPRFLAIAEALADDLGISPEEENDR
jgi:CubicO group peptidase (beta-lactamase class C family)